MWPGVYSTSSRIPSISMRSPSATRMETTSAVALLAHHGDAAGAVAQRAKPGDMVGVQMRVDRFDQLEVELAHELQIAVDPLQHRIDDQRLAAMPAGEQIGIGAGRAVEELAEDHARLGIGQHPLRPIIPSDVAALKRSGGLRWRS